MIPNSKFLKLKKKRIFYPTLKIHKQACILFLEVTIIVHYRLARIKQFWLNLALKFDYFTVRLLVIRDTLVCDSRLNVDLREAIASTGNFVKVNT